MRSDIYELIAHANKVGLYPMMSTNGTILSSEAANKLKRAGMESITISLFGSNSESHDDFCGREGSWARAMAGIRNVASAGIPFQINMCATRHNLDQLDDIANVAKDIGATGINIFDFVPIGRGKGHPELILTPEERSGLVSHIIQCQLADDNLVYRGIGLPQLLVEVEKTVAGKDQRHKFVRTCCGAGLHHCCIFYEGTVYPCALLQKGAGNVRENSFGEIWQKSDVFKVLRDHSKLAGNCKKCGYRELCGGARCQVFERTRSLTKEDSYCLYRNEELKRPPNAGGGEDGTCKYCPRDQLATCEVCGYALCEEHSLVCPICQALLCHPDARDCFFEHGCKHDDNEILPQS